MKQKYFKESEEFEGLSIIELAEEDKEELRETSRSAGFNLLTEIASIS